MLPRQPKAWTELQAGIECLTQFILVVDVMASTPPSHHLTLVVTIILIETSRRYTPGGVVPTCGLKVLEGGVGAKLPS